MQLNILTQNYNNMTKQETEIRNYLKLNYCDRYNIDNCKKESITVDICENGNIIYNGIEIIKSGIKL
jgi:hypothetical protein